MIVWPGLHFKKGKLSVIIIRFLRGIPLGRIFNTFLGQIDVNFSLLSGFRLKVIIIIITEKYVRMLRVDVIIKRDSILLSLKYTESVIDISSIEQNCDP